MTRRENGRSGQFLGHAQTLDMMNTEHVYPALSHRESPEAWSDAGRPVIRVKARTRARGTPASGGPETPAGMEERIARRLPIRRHHAVCAA